MGVRGCRPDTASQWAATVGARGRGTVTCVFFFFFFFFFFTKIKLRSTKATSHQKFMIGQQAKTRHISDGTKIGTRHVRASMRERVGQRGRCVAAPSKFWVGDKKKKEKKKKKKRECGGGCKKNILKKAQRWSFGSGRIIIHVRPSTIRNIANSRPESPKHGSHCKSHARKIRLAPLRPAQRPHLLSQVCTICYRCCSATTATTATASRQASHAPLPPRRPAAPRPMQRLEAAPPQCLLHIARRKNTPPRMPHELGRILNPSQATQSRGE
jgi:hypothetical protein